MLPKTARSILSEGYPLYDHYTIDRKNIKKSDNKEKNGRATGPKDFTAELFERGSRNLFYKASMVDKPAN